MEQVRKPQPKPVEQQRVAQSASAAPAKQRKPNTVRKVVIIALVVVLLAGIAGAVYKLKFAGQSGGLVGVNDEQYQALFLTNGQVYFGKLAQADSKTIKITDIFYLQVQQPVQPAEDGEAAEGETQLIKLGEELHGPEDEMFIDRGQVLFWENLKDSGKVAEAIQAYKKQ